MKGSGPPANAKGTLSVLWQKKSQSRSKEDGDDSEPQPMEDSGAAVAMQEAGPSDGTERTPEPEDAKDRGSGAEAAQDAVKDDEDEVIIVEDSTDEVNMGLRSRLWTAVVHLCCWVQGSVLATAPWNCCPRLAEVASWPVGTGKTSSSFGRLWLTRDLPAPAVQAPTDKPNGSEQAPGAPSSAPTAPSAAPTAAPAAGGSKKRSRGDADFTPAQLEQLQALFASNQYPTTAAKQGLADGMGMDVALVS